MAKGVIGYRPEVKYTAPPVRGDVQVKKSGIAGEEEVSESMSSLGALLDTALTRDGELKQLRDLIEEKSKKLSIAIDPTDRPALSEAISNLTGGQQSGTIDYDVWDKSVRIIQNAFVIQNGFEPTQLLTSEVTADGHKIPRVSIPESMNCDDVANFDLRAHQDSSSSMTVEGAMERSDRTTQLSLLTMLWRMLLAFLLRFAAKLLRGTKLHKVPLAGRFVKRFIRKLESLADRILDWVKNGGASEWSSDNAYTDSDMNELLSSTVDASQNGATKCIESADRVVRHTLHWASHTDTSKENLDVDPLALLMRPKLEQQQSYHEANKFNLLLTVPDGVYPEKVSKLRRNTAKLRTYDNRYFNHKGLL